MDFGITSVAAITVIAYLACAGIKATALDNKWLPLIAGAVGGLLGVLCMYTMPDFPVSDIVSAIAVGIVSGLAATGLNQAGKQLGATIAAEANSAAVIGVSPATANDVVTVDKAATARESETAAGAAAESKGEKNA